MKLNKRIVPVVLSLFVSLLLLAGQVYGQGTTSRVTGTVIDATGAVVPGATVNLTNEANNISFTTQTSSSGAQVMMVTRSGTNQIHGNAFEYYQTPRFSAKSYSGNINNAAKDQFVQHIFGGSVGGPIHPESRRRASIFSDCGFWIFGQTSGNQP